MVPKRYCLGLDFGTNSVRALIAGVENGEAVGVAVEEYRRGEQGIWEDVRNPHVARQHPADYHESLLASVRKAIEAGRDNGEFSPANIIGIGVDTTGSTPLPVNQQGKPLAFDPRFEGNLNAMAWLWKDHSAMAEAEQITELAQQHRPEYLKRCGGTYSSEWFFSKLWHCLNADPDVFEAAYSWVEFCDYIPALLTGNLQPDEIKRSVCAAGHKAMYSEEWGGLPDEDFLSLLDARMGALRERLYEQAYASDVPAGGLSAEWAQKLGLPAGIPVAVGGFDAHYGAVGAGVREGTVVKIIGTSTCDITVAGAEEGPPDIPGVCGVVRGSVLPGYYGIEAGQSAVGDIFNWWVSEICEGGAEQHEILTEQASRLAPGESGLLALDWNNGNRTILVDARLSGLLMGQTLQTTRADVYRALIEATAFGALTILDRLEEYGVGVERIVNCGGIAEKNPMLMQIYADVTGRRMELSRSEQTCALGAAIFGAVVAGEERGGYATTEQAQEAMTGTKDISYEPNSANHEVYQELYGLYRRLHDSFGVAEHSDCLYDVMKRLLEIKGRSA
ncbi:MAG: ribulokinase [Armatimonadetes bacterium]|nr:ribulokinase [Armatimonadota bacterium]